ncbi:MAG TPA: potassium-transporting ATPase subunit C, partial [Streptosporangiaceae bacterium]|nr:potassium-transporting ATPase subunit C [Streptosporangiaceae bacterium]
MLATVRRAVLVSAIFFVLLGLAYPLAATGIGQTFFSSQVNGSLRCRSRPRPDHRQDVHRGPRAAYLGGRRAGRRRAVLLHA